MAIAVLMPALSPTMTEGNLVKWLKKEGDKVKSGDVIAEIETDKATMEVESADAGILGKILVPEKTEGVKVNQLIGVLLEVGEKKEATDAIIEKYKSTSVQHKDAETKANSNVPEVVNSSNTPVHTIGTRVLASPLARRIAVNEGIDLKNLKGTGPYGRIVKRDVLAANSSGAMPNLSIGRNPNEYRIEPASQMRKVIAKRLVESKTTVPHFYLTADCELDCLLKLREEINAKAVKNGDAPAYKISVNDFVIKAAAHALRAVPSANSSWSEEGVITYNNIDISVAVAINDGLITPIIRNADQKGIAQISNEMKALANKAKESTLRPEEFQGGGFSISNLGMYGVKEFKAIVNPPQSCILAVGVAEKRPVVRDDKVEIATIMTISLSCDHRVVDGAIGAELLNALKTFIQNPALMLV